MGLLDKVKEQAATATAAAKEAAAKGQSKLDELQAKKAADSMLRDLGALTYGAEMGRGAPSAENDAQRIVAALKAHEADHGEVSLALESSAGKQTS